MPRPRKYRRINGDFSPPVDLFYPKEVTDADKIFITVDELEALRLRYYDDGASNIRLNQTEAAKQMGISQTTYSRMLNNIFSKLTRALIEGKAIAILSKGPRIGLLNGSDTFETEIIFDGYGCLICGLQFEKDLNEEMTGSVALPSDIKPDCPNCSSKKVYRLKKKGPIKRK